MQTPKYQKSFLKWAGGKGRLLEQLFRHIPRRGDVFIEPFLGSGVVFANTDYERYYLNDSNTDLINVFRYIRDSADEFIYKVNEKFLNGNHIEAFKTLRIQYNQSQDSLERAVLFYYLNKHCYNGLYRVSKGRGEYNVSFGRYSKPSVSEFEIYEYQKILNDRNIELSNKDYLSFLESLPSFDGSAVCYMDPPYFPISATSSFTGYASSDFRAAEHALLHDAACKLSAQGVKSFISNSDSSASWRLYSGNKIRFLDVNRSISCSTQGRGEVSELLIEY